MWYGGHTGELHWLSSDYLLLLLLNWIEWSATSSNQFRCCCHSNNKCYHQMSPWHFIIIPLICVLDCFIFHYLSWKWSNTFLIQCGGSNVTMNFALDRQIIETSFGFVFNSSGGSQRMTNNNILKRSNYVTKSSFWRR